jgi:phage terminase large subunit GpA-like protein
LKPDPYVDFVDWANENFRLTKESSVEPGKYRSSRTPWVEEILRELSPQSKTQEVVVIKPTQAAFTTIGNIMLCCIAHRYPGPAMFVQPTDDMVKKHSKKKLAPTVKAIPCLKDIIKPTRSRDSGNTLLLKEFQGGSWTLTGSNSPASARSDSVRYLILDDYDGFVQDAGGEGEPGDLFINRTDAFGNKKKIYKNSTPTLKETSHIDKDFEESSQGHFNVPCPHCDEMQYLEFGGPDAEFGIKFDRDDDGQIIDVWYVCQHCHKRIDEWQKTEMLSRGKYIHKYPDRMKRGFKINSQYSPLGWVSWRQIAEEFLKAVKAQKRGDTRKMKKWVNTRQAESWEEDGEQPEWNRLSSRAEPYKILTVPYAAGLLTCGVDTQDNRLEVIIDAWGPGEENWVIYQSAIYGDPDLPAVWQQLDELLFRTYRHESGAELSIKSMGIDSGGHKTQAVYNYCRKRSPVVFALKGASTGGKPIIGRPTKQDVSFSGKMLKSGVSLYQIGTDIAKGTIYNRLKLNAPGPGYIHFPIGLDDEFYKQLTAEKLVSTYNKSGFKTQHWIKTRERNDVLDCKQYSYAAAIKAGLQRTNWDKIFFDFKTKSSSETEKQIENQSSPAKKNVKNKSKSLPKKKDWFR